MQIGHVRIFLQHGSIEHNTFTNNLRIFPSTLRILVKNVGITGVYACGILVIVVLVMFSSGSQVQGWTGGSSHQRRQ